MNAESLKVLISNWINQSNLPENTSLRILASRDSVQVHLQFNPLLINCLDRNYLPEEFNDHLISVTRNTVIRKLRIAKIDWNKADLFDFLNLFPTKELFSHRRGAGKKSIILMGFILTNNNLSWPDK